MIQSLQLTLIFFFRDISNLDDHVHLLNQRYASEIPGWQALGDFSFSR